ncbi:hypothetical protein [Streptomyces sp. NPDC002276]
MSKIKARLVTVAGVLALAAGLVVAGGNQAGAVTVYDDFSFTGLLDSADGYWSLTVHNDTKNKNAGYAAWQADGDTLIAYDGLGDGYGIVAHLSDGREASTAGLSSPVTVKKGGNLPENHTYQMWVCVVKGDAFKRCSYKIDVNSS